MGGKAGDRAREVDQDRRVDQRENSIANKSTESEKGNLVEERAIHLSIESESGFTGDKYKKVEEDLGEGESKIGS